MGIMWSGELQSKYPLLRDDIRINDDVSEESQSGQECCFDLCKILYLKPFCRKDRFLCFQKVNL